MITGSDLLKLLRASGKDNRDLIRYMANGLRAHNEDHCLLPSPLISFLQTINESIGEEKDIEGSSKEIQETDLNEKYKKLSNLINDLEQMEPIYHIGAFAECLTKEQIATLASILTSYFFEKTQVEDFISRDEEGLLRINGKKKSETDKYRYYTGHDIGPQETDKVEASACALSYEDFIKGTKISREDELSVKIKFPDRKQVIVRSKDDLGFSSKGKAIWSMFINILDNGSMDLGLIPKDKETLKLGENIKPYVRYHKQLQRISIKLVKFFNKERRNYNIPESYFFFESDGKGIFKPKFITDSEADGLQVIREFEKKGISQRALLGAAGKIEE